MTRTKDVRQQESSLGGFPRSSRSPLSGAAAALPGSRGVSSAPSGLSPHYRVVTSLAFVSSASQETESLRGVITTPQAPGPCPPSRTLVKLARAECRSPFRVTSSLSPAPRPGRDRRTLSGRPFRKETPSPPAKWATPGPCSGSTTQV